jgi:hypothetical protein
MNVLVACEFSGVVRDAFLRRGHNAWSCDLLPTESEGPHIQGNVLDIIGLGWDLMIAHPPCTYLTVSGNRWFEPKHNPYWETRMVSRARSVDFFMCLVEASIPRICVENPVGRMNRWYKKPTQVIQPWQFGHGETKKTCLWLKNLSALVPTNIVEGRKPVCHLMGPSAQRSHLRSITYRGIAEAMAEQWGELT